MERPSRFCKVCGCLIPDSAHKNRTTCMSGECQQEQGRRRNAEFRERHREARAKRIRGVKSTEMISRLRENARDKEARAWCRQKHIGYLFLSRDGEKPVEIRFKK